MDTGSNENIVGIDFGTSTSEIAVLRDGKPRVIYNHTGEQITPSAVSFAGNQEVIIGREARDQMLLKPDQTVIEVKRMMGEELTLAVGGKEYTPQQVASYILSYLVQCARQELKVEITSAVITVPAYFTDQQRKAVIEAGELAGLKVERIINEPTAAALDYGIEHMEECKNILVYDLGGGTLDVTVLEMFEGVLEVKASSGNNKLGGKDFDQKLIDHLLKNFISRHGLDPSTDKRALLRLKDEAEKCKIDLSNEEEYPLVLPMFASLDGEPVALEENISRTFFEELIKDDIDSTKLQIDSALADSGFSAQDLDLVLLVGGSTRIPYVHRFIEQTLGQAPRSLVDPDLAVVRGAAIQAGILGNQFDSKKDILITDVCPYTLGTAVINVIGGFPVPDSYDVIIPRNLTIPVTREKVYCTVHDNQVAVEVEAYQGENKKASYNNLLGKFLLSDIPPAPAFQERIGVSFAYDANGILQVEGKILSTGQKANLVIETAGRKMEPEGDLEGWDKAQGARKYRAIIKKATKMIEEDEAYFFQNEMEALIHKIKAGLLKGEDKKTLDEYKKELHEIIYELELIDKEDEDD